MDEEHWCWSLCCDQGPHTCICGNNCGRVNFLRPWKGSGVVVQEDDGYYYGEGD